jgi:hypothetical protein
MQKLLYKDEFAAERIWPVSYYIPDICATTRRGYVWNKKGRPTRLDDRYEKVYKFSYKERYISD